MSYKLIRPAYEFESKFIEYVNDYKNKGDQKYFKMYEEALLDYNLYVKKLVDFSNGINLPENRVGYLTFWLVNQDNDIIGNLRLRKELTNTFLQNIAGNIGYDIAPRFRGIGYGTLILNLGIEEAKQCDLKRILVTCRKDNIASKKVIEKNGGIFESEIYNGVDSSMYLRYWFDLEKDDH